MPSQADPGDPSDPSGATLGLLRTLVAFETVSETPNLALQHWLAERVVERGGVARVVDGAAGRANLLARFGPAGPGGVLFAGHTDVVPPGDGWSHDPWAMHVRDGTASGRGTADMKGFFAAVLVALDAIDVESLRAPVHLLASYDEEIGCVGIRDVLPMLAAETVRPDLVVVGEPTSMRPRLSHLGKQAYSVTVSAQSGHSSRAASMPSAITEAARLIAVLGAIQASCPPSEGDSVTSSIPYSINVGTIHGGSQLNVIAASCTFDFEVRFDVDHNADVVIEPFLACATATSERLRACGGAVVVERRSGYPALRSDDSETAFRDAVRLADRGPVSAIGFGTEGGLIAEALDAPVMVCGPGDIAVAHRPDEFVPVDELVACVRFTQSLVDRFCIGEA